VCDEPMPASAPLLCIEGAALDPVTSVRDLTWSCGHTYSKQYQDVSLHFANYIRSAVRCRHPRPGRWWSLVLSRLDYGNAVLVASRPIWYVVTRLQSVLNAAARLIYHMRSADHITDALVSLRWLRVPERIQYKIALLTYEAHSGAPRTRDHSLGSHISQVDEHCALPALVACWYHPSSSQQSGTPCRKRRHQHHH